MTNLPPLLVKLIRDTQAQAIREKGFVPDSERYAYASATLWREILENNSSSNESVKADLQDTAQLMREIGPFQNPTHLFGLVGYNRQVLEVARRMGIVDDSWVPFATATFGSVNAVTKRIRSHYVIIFNDGLFSLVELISQQVAYAFTIFADEGDPGESVGDALQRTFRGDSEIVQSLLSTIVSYVVTGDPRVARKQIPAHLLRDDGVHRLLRDTALRFVVAHELGHVYLRHLEVVASPETAPPSEVSYRWRSEYEADRFAAEIAFQSIVNTQTNAADSKSMLQLLAIELQPMLQVLISHAVDYLNYGKIPQREDDIGTHPPSDRRFARVRASIEASMRDATRFEKEQLEQAQVISTFVGWALLPPLKERCLQLRRAGVKAV